MSVFQESLRRPIKRRSLTRSMKTFGTLMLSLSSITPASSVFIIAPGVLQQAGTGAFWSFIAAAIVSIFTALVYAELSSAWPLTGGEYTIVGRIFNPFVGFVVLGVNLMTAVFTVSAISLGLATYIQPVFPGAGPVESAITMIALTTLIGILNVRLNAYITGVFLAIEMLVLVVMAYVGLEHIQHPLSEMMMHPIHLGASGNLEPASMSVIGLAMTVALFAYNGYGQTVYLGEEAHDAPKTIAKSILLSLGITVFIETIPVTAMLMGAPDSAALFNSSSMLTDMLGYYGGQTLVDVVSLGVALAIFNAMIAMVILYGRQFFSTGRDHVWPNPINYALTRIHPRLHSPWVATLVFGAFASAGCLIDQNLLFLITGTSIVVVYGALCAAVIAGRINGKTKHATYKMPLYPFAPIAGLVSLAYVIFANYQDESVGRPSLYAAVAMIVLSSAYYWFVLRRRGAWRLRNPIAKRA